MRAVNGPAGFGAWIPAEVPGCVHTDLLRAGKIPDPFVGTNEKALQWIERTDWEYRTTFAADAALLARERIEIVFQGLDTYAEVSVNGARVLSADNMFRSWRADIKPHVVVGQNAVVVRFRSPIAVAKPLYDRLGYTLPAANDQAKEMVSMFTRKAPYQYGWDWGPRFVTSGIWRRVAIEAWDEARLDDVQVYPAVARRRARAAGGRRGRRGGRAPGARGSPSRSRGARRWGSPTSRSCAGATRSGWRWRSTSPSAGGRTASARRSSTRWRRRWRPAPSSAGGGRHASGSARWRW